MSLDHLATYVIIEFTALVTALRDCHPRPAVVQGIRS
jgi:hypothetical protein